ncbi:hypothetical protein BD289DRAFT_252786 [Coniella lustricola]|uniref:Uncharacterized protein n=1 Tax=Coniella lustricola TaxID=2025994 RepID=A0A2T3A8F3_9PEZI|nr:hypothetical protein BD289DRAFT_252786 [Coniella lustricola]
MGRWWKTKSRQRQSPSERPPRYIHGKRRGSRKDKASRFDALPKRLNQAGRSHLPAHWPPKQQTRLVSKSTATALGVTAHTSLHQGALPAPGDDARICDTPPLTLLLLSPATHCSWTAMLYAVLCILYPIHRYICTSCECFSRRTGPTITDLKGGEAQEQ